MFGHLDPLGDGADNFFCTVLCVGSEVQHLLTKLPEDAPRAQQWRWGGGGCGSTTKLDEVGVTKSGLLFWGPYVRNLVVLGPC